MENTNSTSGAKIEFDVQPSPIPFSMDGIIKERTLIIGAGEIGNSLKKVLDDSYTVHIRDKELQGHETNAQYRVINICFPYSDKFVEYVNEYAKRYNPELIIIHSTVPVGTTRKIKNAVHSPVNGRHPDLEKGIKVFVKMIGATKGDLAYMAARFLIKAGLNMKVMSSPEATEMAKILCTTYLGWNVIFMKEVERICEQFGLPFHEVYTEWNSFYNAGYINQQEHRFVRPILFPLPGPIGGHCVIPNCDLLDSFLTKVVKEKNQEYAEQYKTRQRNLAPESVGDTDKQHRKGLHNSQPRLDRKGRKNWQ